MDHVRDIANMVHACQNANEAETAIAIRCTSLFDELYKAAQIKECRGNEVKNRMEMHSGMGTGSVIEVGSESIIEVGSDSVIEVGSESVIEVGLKPERQAPKPQFRPEVEELIKWFQEQLRDARSQAASKWTWGVDLTDEDLAKLVRGADRGYELPHLGYDDSLSSEALHSMTSERLNADALEDPDDEDLRFDDLSGPMEIPELHFPELKFHFLSLDVPERMSLTTSLTLSSKPSPERK
jgi:hypothetical protein